MPTKYPSKYDSNFVIRQSKIHGKGAFALKSFRKGQRIAEYTGEIIPCDEADRRADEARMKKHHTFVFEICNGDVCIDATKDGGPAKWINHSCDPNCEAIELKGRVYIQAMRAVKNGDELSYDYDLRGGPKEKNWKTKYACSCGAEICTGNMLTKPKIRQTRKHGPRRRA